MKTKALLLLLAAFIINIGAFAQEDDDMYFNATDRVKLQSKERQDQIAYEASVKKAKKMREEPAVEEEGESVESVEALNPTDSYSARNVNPEYEARSTAKLSQSDDQDYFVNNYQYSTSSNMNNWNNNFNSWYGSSWYTPNYYNSNINSWNSPYYGYADPYYSPWYNPYWNNNGWSASFSYYWGNSYNNYGNYGYGWGGNYNYWNRPYCGYASSWGFGYGYNSGYPGWYGYPGSVIIINNGEGTYGPRYAKRGSRGNDVVNTTRPSPSTRTQVSDAFGSNNRSQRQATAGRTSNLNNNAVTPANTTNGRSRQQGSEYYNRTWRRVTQEPSNASNSNSNSNSGNSSNGRTSNSNSNWNNGNSNSDRSYTPSRSSNNDRSNSSFGNSNSGGGGRSSGGYSGGNSGGGRSRGGRGN
ncbi:hypothetical protein [Parachryseolinea silvisoli]|uniref:hypothetical protein n=1 Tax=Parachryseolinea silvisoli TaxID=2873601 RepID=UPI002265A448|nr:hypothetical protein [Parachryseolinea silvisoli]MCD9019556.1 hypothetical protein [Parachryseolinea silvisoli]